MFSPGAIIGTIVAVALVIGGGAWYLIDRNNQLQDFGDDVAAMEFVILDVSWDDEEDSSELEARVLVNNCWIIELSREEGEENLLTTINERQIEMLRFDEIHLDPSFFGDDEPDVHDFTYELTHENVEKYMQERKDTYSCRKDYDLAA